MACASSVTAPSEPGTTGTQALGRRFRLDLVAHDADVLGRRTDEGDAVLFQDLSETRVLDRKP
jgi:hypothetical protein